VSDAWKKHELGGGGLQQAKLRLARALRRQLAELERKKRGES